MSAEGWLFEEMRVLLGRHHMTHVDGPDTEESAADVVRPHLGKIQALVLAAYEAHGPMSAREAERLPEFGDYGFSTIRKRISELASDGLLVALGIDHTGRAPATIYKVTTSDTGGSHEQD